MTSASFCRRALAFLVAAISIPATAAPPRSLDDRITIELVAQEPEIVTPTGIAVDNAGRIYCIESHTHFRPEGYTGPPADRIRVFDDFDEQGRARKITTFFEGTHATMGMKFNADQSWLYFVARSELFRIRDTNQDGVADERETLVKLETAGDYPHNGLNGCAFDQGHNVYFGQGENLGAPWKLIGKDGVTIEGGDGGRLYRCRYDGKGLEQIAEGCWNPFGQCFDIYGNLFVVDNDPDSRPPCRLLHVVPGADFGYRYSNGRKGLHPFSAWNGDLPGALPMVAGTGEAPSNVLNYPGGSLPMDYWGRLFVTSWGDHRIDTYPLELVGASFRSAFQPLIVGDEDFRPVGIATAPDGSLVVSDWVDKSYELHGKGRIWRVRAKKKEEVQPLCAVPAVEGDLQTAMLTYQVQPAQEGLRSMAKNEPPFVRAEALRQLTLDADSEPIILEASKSPDPFLAQAARRPLVKAMQGGWQPANWLGEDAALRLTYLLAAKEAHRPPDDATMRAWLADDDEAIRMTAVRWVGEERLAAFRAEVTATLSRSGQSPRAFATSIATLERLDGVQRNVSDEDAGATYVAKLIADPNLDLEVLERAVGMLSPQDKALNSDVLNRLLESGRPAARQTVLHIWSDRSRDDDHAKLFKIAQDESVSLDDRAAAIAGLQATNADITGWLSDIACQQDNVLAHEALRTLRGAELNDDMKAKLKALVSTGDARTDLAKLLLAPTTTISEATPNVDEWITRLEGAADPSAGERIFFHPKGPGCFKCHSVAGRGAQIGPDLTTTARQLDRRRLIASILTPSAEVAPQFTTWNVLTHDGITRQGMLVAESVEGTQTYLQADGTTFDAKQAEIAARAAIEKSVMPDHLETLMTEQEFQDLLGFLSPKD